MIKALINMNTEDSKFSSKMLHHFIFFQTLQTQTENVFSARDLR